MAKILPVQKYYSKFAKVIAKIVPIFALLYIVFKQNPFKGKIVPRCDNAAHSLPIIFMRLIYFFIKTFSPLTMYTPGTMILLILRP